ncbi:J domain-containing protein [bacterium]|nr:J domain-containing protein [bacterium]
MLKNPSFYVTLGVSLSASQSEIRAAYRKLAKRFHPDANAGDPRSEARFKKIGEAYEVLGDSGKRRDYDRGYASRSRSGRSPSRKQHAERAFDSNVKIRLYLTIAAACKGGYRKVRFNRRTVCVVCEGLGEMQVDGTGCKTCQGSGSVSYEHTVRVNYPAGVCENEKLIIAGEGHIMSSNSRPGDLMVTVVYKPHQYLEARDGDLHYNCFIGLDHYIQGGRLKVPTVDGKTVLYLEPRISDGETIRLSKRGLPAHGGKPAGDLIITIRHCLPKKLSRKEMERIKELMRLPGFSPPVDAKGFFPRGVD